VDTSRTAQKNIRLVQEKYSGKILFFGSAHTRIYSAPGNAPTCDCLHAGWVVLLLARLREWPVLA
jgi:hypothetical protein